jgi:hypothetical protein
MRTRFSLVAAGQRRAINTKPFRGLAVRMFISGFVRIN